MSIPTPKQRPLVELSQRELEELHLNLKTLVTDLQLQLEQRHQPDNPENGAAWNEFRAWRGRVNGLMKSRRRYLTAVRDEVRRRHQANEDARAEARHATGETIEDRRARLAQDLESGDPSALLLDASRLIHRLLRTVEDQRASLDDRDFDTLTRMSDYLKYRYGRGPVNRYLHQ